MNMTSAYPVMGTLLALAAPAHALTYGLAGGSENWPADKRNAIVACMDEAVAIYNSNGHFDKHVTANYDAGVPTAQASYSGWIDFGGSIGTRVALHEIAHTLGVGQYWSWTDGGWWGPAANARVKLYEGQNAGIGTGGGHFWPYGMNFDNEDTGAVSRERHCKMVAAMRWDMGIVVDSDGDGMPDDWETFHFGNLGVAGNGDADGDGVTNLEEYATDSNPNIAGPTSGGTFKLRAQHSGKLIDVWGASTADGGNVVQWGENGGTNQHWTATHVGGGWFEFANVNSSKLLETAGMGLNDGDNVQQWAALNNSGQQWRLAGGSNGFWRICNRQSGKAIDVNGISTADGANIQQWTDWGGQLWEFLPAQQQPPAATIHVSDITLATVSAGQGKKRGQARVTILSSTGVPVSNATVIASFTGSFSETVAATTNGSGIAVLTTSGTAKGGVSFTCCIQDVSGTLSYDAGQNVETCDSL